jgi:hypothetical protein
MNNDASTNDINTNNMQDYLADFIDEFGLDMLSEEEQEAFLGDLADALYESVLLDVAVQLSDADRDALTTLIERATSSTETNNEAHQEAVFSFLKLKVPNLDEIIKFEAEKLKQEYLALQEQVSQEK